ncbi:MAG: multimeric flavodoxin WrbA [Verrucomicrobiales bacterium]|jgi:multimeric flavodoxin WrbA
MKSLKTKSDMKKTLILSSSPRRDGNSYRMAAAALEGALEAGHQAELAYVDDYLKHFLRDCRLCRGADHQCSLDDRYKELFLEKYLPADGVIFSTPLYWYGMSGQLKTFFDRSFCYYAASCTESEQNSRRMANKRLGLLISSEETYPAAPMGIIHSIQEFTRYTHCEFVGVVQGIGNKRGDVDIDPSEAITRSRNLGADLYEGHYSDYRMDTPRLGSVWAE